MVVLDIAIVNVALPSIGRELDFAEDNLQWVITAYSLTFGGFLLLGGRAADLLGRRRMFMIGVGFFALASLGCGLANSEATGVLFGGILTKYLGWEWIFFVNVPIGVLVVALTPALVQRSRREVRRRYDAIGAVVVTAGLVLFVYAISEAPDVGWATFRTVGVLVVSAVLLAF